MNTTPHTEKRGLRGRSAILLSFVTVLATSGATGVMTSQGAARLDIQGYRWPVKPFGKAHPIRGNFGDPRTTFYGTPSVRTLMKSDGNFHVHEGVDIAAPDGTPVYPVKSGTVHIRSRETVIVTSPDGARFDYWHMVLAVREGQQVTAHTTILGRVRNGYEHVHLTEWDGGRPINPLTPGHLSPYRDTTKPQVTSVSFQANGSPQLPELVRGRVDVVASAYDMPAMKVHGRWGGLPVAPALLTWKVIRLEDGKVAIRPTVGFDVRGRMPAGAFWGTYARGTRQNMSSFGGRRAWLQPAVYLYRLAVLDTNRLKDDAYKLVVTASDMRGNLGSFTQIFSVRNDHAWPAR